MSRGYNSTGLFLGAANAGGWDVGLNPRPGGNFAGWQPQPGNFAGWQPQPGNFAGWQPQPGNFAGWQPQPGNVAGWQPRPGGNSDERPHVGAYAVDPATASPWPWRGMDPDWTYASGDALLAQALRKSQTRLVGARDPRRGPAVKGKVRETASTELPLWRWGSEFRQQAVVAELLGHTVVHGHTVFAALYDLNQPAPVGHLHPVLELRAPPDDFDYSQQIDKVMRAAVEREERLPEMLTQAADFRAFFYRLGGLVGKPTPHLDELILVAWAWATHTVMALKNNVHLYRPAQRSSLITPVIDTPQHGSMPSGHATIAALTAELLSVLLYQPGDRRTDVLHRLASRIAFNRVVAGVHFPMDSYAGWYLGAQLASWFWSMAQSSSPLPAPVLLPIKPNSEWAEGDVYPVLCRGPSAVEAPAVESLRQLWTAADNELRDLRF